MRHPDTGQPLNAALLYFDALCYKAKKQVPPACGKRYKALLKDLVKAPNIGDLIQALEVATSAHDLAWRMGYGGARGGVQQ